MLPRRRRWRLSDPSSSASHRPRRATAARAIGASAALPRRRARDAKTPPARTIACDAASAAAARRPPSPWDPTARPRRRSSARISSPCAVRAAAGGALRRQAAAAELQRRAPPRSGSAPTTPRHRRAASSCARAFDVDAARTKHGSARAPRSSRSAATAIHRALPRPRPPTRAYAGATRVGGLAFAVCAITRVGSTYRRRAAVRTPQCASRPCTARAGSPFSALAPRKSAHLGAPPPREAKRRPHVAGCRARRRRRARLREPRARA